MMLVVYWTPGVWLSSSSILCAAASVRSSEAASGNCNAM